MARVMLIVPTLLLLAACATLPAAQTEVFDKLAQGDREAFRSAVAAHRAAVRAYATDSLVEGKGTLRNIGCDHTKPSDICTNVFSVNGIDIPTAEVAPQASKLIGTVAQYGSAMKDLGAAKDLDALNGKIDGAFTAITALLSATGIGGVAAPALILVGQITKGSYKQKRFAQMRAFAKAADPAIQRTATILTADGKAIKSGILGAVGPRLTTAQLETPQAVTKIAVIKGRLATPNRSPVDVTADEQELATIEPRVRYLINDQFDASAQLQGSRFLKDDFSALGLAHTKIVESLEDPKADIDESLKYANKYLSDLKNIKSAF